MNTTLKDLCTLGVGVIAGALICRKYYENKYKTIAEDAIASVKNIYTTPKSEKSEEIKKEETEKPDSTEVKSPVNDVIYTKVEPNRFTDYKGCWTSKDAPEREMAEKEAPREEDKRPYIITEEMYTDEEPYFEKTSCTFYVPNHVVVDDLSREVVEPGVIGEDNIEYLLKMAQNGDFQIIYIRNESISVDMEISIEPISIEDSGAMVWFGDN